jgi:surfactin synthase thioesterase subunit
MPDEQPVLLHCFAHAGAGVSSFNGWSARLGPGVAAVPHLLPGRDGRRREARVTTRQALLADLMDDLTTAPHTPYVLYGHSLGALVAYTLTRALHEARLPGPALLVVGACPPPDAASALPDACRQGDEHLLQLLDTVGAVPEGAASGSFWYRSVMPVLRADLALADRLRRDARTPAAGGPLTVPAPAIRWCSPPNWRAGGAGRRGRCSPAPCPATTSSSAGPSCPGCWGGPAASFGG